MNNRKTFFLLVCISAAVLWGCVGEAPPEPAQELLLVLNKSSNTATLLDARDGEKIRDFVLGVAPHEVALEPRSHIAVVGNYGNRENPGSSLTVINLEERRLVRTIGLKRFRRPHGLQFFNDGARVAVTVEGNQALIIVNVGTGEVEKVIPTRQEVSHMVALSPDNSTAYVSNIGSGTVSVIDVEESRLVRNLRVGEGSEGLDISPDGRELWVANRAEDTVAIVDTETLETLDKVPSESFPIRVKFLPDGSRVLVSNARSGDVAVFSASERREVARVPMELSALEKKNRLLQFELSPVPIGIVVDQFSNRAFVANSNADVVSVIDLETLSVVDRFLAGEEPDGMVFDRIETTRIE